MEHERESMPYAQVSRAEVRPGRIDDAVARWKQLLASQRGMTGFRDAFLLIARSSRICLAISLWDSRNQVEQRGTECPGLVQRADEFATPPAMEAYRVPVRTARIESASHARVTSAHIKGPAEIESGVIWQEALPEYRHVAGFRGAFTLEALHSARGIVVTFWESEDDARRQSDSGMRTEVLSRFAEVMAGPPNVEDFEAVLQILT